MFSSRSKSKKNLHVLLSSTIPTISAPLDLIVEKLYDFYFLQEAAEIKFSLRLIGTGNRDSSTLLVMEAGKTLNGVLFKKPHHFVEPKISRRASDLGLGPYVFYSDTDLIIEEWFDSSRSWRNLAEINNLPPPRQFAKEVLNKYYTMLVHKTVHAFDSLPNHLFVLEFDGIDFRWIDWGKPKYLDAPAATSHWRTADHFSALIEILAPLQNGPMYYCALVSEIKTMVDVERRIFFEGILAQVRRDLENPNSFSYSRNILAPKWVSFFNNADTLLDFDNLHSY
ncbi:MAG: hypothetical protein WAW23_09335 [Candidatus Methanoperedens sp.]